MIEQVEEIGAEAQTLTLGDLERLAERDVHVLLWRPDDAVARRVAVKRGVAVSASGKSREGVGGIRVGVYPTAQPRGHAAGTGRVRAGESGLEACRCQVRAAEGVRASARGIYHRKRRARLQRDHTAHFPSAQGGLGQTAGAGEEWQLINRAGDEALAPIEI